MAEQITNGWNEWSRHVLAELERLNNKADTLERELVEFRVDMAAKFARLDARAGLIGAVAATIPVGIAALVAYLKGQ